MIASVMRIQVGGKVVEGSAAGDFVELLRDLGVDVARRQRDFFGARVLLGHVLRQLRDRLSRASFIDLVEESGIHRRRVTEAMRLAEEVAKPNGEVDWGKYRQLVGEGSQPSVRAVIARAQQRDYDQAHRRLDGTLEEEPIVLVDADDEDDAIELVDADTAEPPQFAGSAGTRVPERSVNVREEEGIERSRVSGEGVEPAARVSGDGVAPEARASAKGAAGEQLGLGELFLQAERQLEDLERTLELLGVEDAGSLLVAVRDRIRH